MTTAITIDPTRLLHLDNDTIVDAEGRVRTDLTTWTGNLLAEAESLRTRIENAAEHSTILAWSGTLAESFFESDPRTWLRPGREAFNTACDAIIEPLNARNLTLCFRPCARHVLSDPQSCMQFLLAREDQPFAIALDPASMFELTMLDTPEDHLTRMFETLGDRVALLILSDVPTPSDGDDDSGHFASPLPLGDGCLPIETIQALVDRTIPATTPVLLPAIPAS